MASKEEMPAEAPPTPEKDGGGDKSIEGTTKRWGEVMGPDERAGLRERLLTEDKIYVLNKDIYTLEQKVVPLEEARGKSVAQAAAAREQKEKVARAQEEERRTSETQVAAMRQDLAQKEEEIRQLSEEYRQTWFFQFSKKRGLGMELALGEAEVRRQREELGNFPEAVLPDASRREEKEEHDSKSAIQQVESELTSLKEELEEKNRQVQELKRRCEILPKWEVEGDKVIEASLQKIREGGREDVLKALFCSPAKEDWPGKYPALLRKYEAIKEIQGSTSTYQYELRNSLLTPALLGGRWIHQLFRDTAILSTYYSNDALFDELRSHAEERARHMREIFKEAGAELEIPVPLEVPLRPPMRSIDKHFIRQHKALRALPEVRSRVLATVKERNSSNFVVDMENIGLDFHVRNEKSLDSTPILFSFSDWMM